MRTHLIRSAFVAIMLSLHAGGARAHTETRDAIPVEPGFKLGLAAAGSYLSASSALLSKAMPGYLLRGDTGIDLRGTSLEHAVVQAGYRFNKTLGLQLAIGKHGSDPLHVEAAWLQARGTLGETDWTFGAGRQRPSLGQVITSAGHLDRFGLMPLAKQVASNGDWIDDGIELGLRRDFGSSFVMLDAGLWSARSFPGGQAGRVAPALHLGINFPAPGGDLTLDGFASWMSPRGRGSLPVSLNGAHSHNAPVCNAALTKVVCFDGNTRLLGASLHWQGSNVPLSVTAATLWRDDDGQLSSNNGQGQYQGKNRGDWAQVLWRFRPGWETGLRAERVSATQSLVGPGANLLSQEAGFNGYAPMRRVSLTLAREVHRAVTLRLELGRETSPLAQQNYAGIRVVFRMDDVLARPGATGSPETGSPK